jgi:hypothetical protein
MQITIKSIHITEYQQATWGRVYVQYEQDNKELFVYKNWLQFVEKTFNDEGSLTIDTSAKAEDGRSKHVYFWFEANKRHVYENYKDVLDGKADHLYLTSEKYRKEYGTPSIILKRLLIELKANLNEPAKNRIGWFERFYKPNLVLSPIVVSGDYEIRLSLYDNFEINFEPLLKLVYVLFLNHPEGIVLAKLKTHKDELFKIYLNLMKDDDYEKLQARIDKLIDRDGNGLHEKISKINKIFKDELGDKISPYYQITGSKEQPYKINLSAPYPKAIE